LQLSLTHDFPKKLADPRQVIPYTYRDSPLTIGESGFSGGVQAGDVAIDSKIAEGDYLLDHLGTGFTGLYFCEQERLDDRATETFERLAAVDRHFRPLIVATRPVAGTRIEVLEDRSGSIFSAYAAADRTFYLVRPDLYVAARWRSAEPGTIENTLLTILGRT
jgi:3-(3-hydroxy-phenyl)propionate hydroxylase